MTIEFRKLKGNETYYSEAIGVLLEAFENEAVTNYLIDLSKSKAYKRYSNALHILGRKYISRGDHIWVALEDGEVLGIAVLQLPKEMRNPQGKGPKLKEYSILFPLLKEIKYSKLPSLIKMMKPSIGVDSAWITLGNLAVSPAAQGKGIGSQLLSHVQHTYQNSATIYLTTGLEITKEYYERFGFRLIDQKSNDELTVYHMVWEQ